MKKSGFTFLFVIVCVGVLVAAYGVGVCIREIRFRSAQESEVSAKVDKPGTETKPEGTVQKPTPPAGDQEPEDGPPPQRMGGPGGMPGMPTREELENMSEEEKKEAMAKMRERFGGRRREGGPQLSEEDRVKLKEDMEKLMERAEEMSEEERQEARAKIFKKYGITPRRPGSRPGGDRGLGGGGGGRRRSRPDEGQ